MNEHHQKPTDKDPAKFVRSVFDLAYGPIGEETLTSDEIKQELTDSGIDHEKGYAKLQAIFKKARGQAGLAVARKERLKAATEIGVAGSLTDTIESLKQQIAGFLALSGESSVYARKWENCSVEDLVILRDQLARTAARAAQRKDAQK